MAVSRPSPSATKVIGSLPNLEFGRDLDSEWSARDVDTVQRCQRVDLMSTAAMDVRVLLDDVVPAPFSAAMHLLRLATAVGCLPISLFPTVTFAQTINFTQAGGEIGERTIVQSGNANNRIIGITPGGRVSDGTSAYFSGDFSSIVLEQTGNAAQTLGARVAVSDTADINFKMQTATASSLLVDVIAGTYLSDITLSGFGGKTVNVMVNAPSKVVSQNVDLTGGKINLRVNQTNAASLTLDYSVLGTFRDTVEINQTGLNTEIDLISTSKGASNFMVRMAGDDSAAYINANLGFGSSISYSVYRDGVSLGSPVNPVDITVSDYSNVTVTVND